MNLREIFSGALTPARWRALGEYLQGGAVRGGVGIRVRRVGDRVIVSAGNRARGSGLAAGSYCAFGRIVSTDDGKAIVGGIIHAGDKNFNVPDQEVDLGSDGAWLVSIALDVTANRDDDEEILLPGIETADDPPGTWTLTSDPDNDESYPDNTAPTIPAGEGTIVLPIGRLVVADGAATLTPAGCGNFTVGHCSGTLSYTRS